MKSAGAHATACTHVCVFNLYKPDFGRVGDLVFVLAHAAEERLADARDKAHVALHAVSAIRGLRWLL